MITLKMSILKLSMHLLAKKKLITKQICVDVVPNQKKGL